MPLYRYLSEVSELFMDNFWNPNDLYHLVYMTLIDRKDGLGSVSATVFKKSDVSCEILVNFHMMRTLSCVSFYLNCRAGMNDWSLCVIMYRPAPFDCFNLRSLVDLNEENFDVVKVWRNDCNTRRELNSPDFERYKRKREEETDSRDQL